MSPRQATLALVESEAPAQIVARNHVYNGKPGVTGILKVQDAINSSDGLVRWAVNLAAKAAWDHARDSEHPEWATALEAAVAAVEEPRNKGSRVHDGISKAIIDEPHIPAVTDGPMFYQFSRFLLKHKPEILGTEFYLLGDEWGGQGDMDCVIDGKRSLLDVKSGKYKDTFALQLAAYSACRWMAPSPSGQPVTAVPKWEAFYVLLLTDTGYELKEETVGKAEIDHFRFLVRTHQQLHAWKKGKAA